MTTAEMWHEDMRAQRVELIQKARENALQTERKAR